MTVGGPSSRGTAPGTAPAFAAEHAAPAPSRQAWQAWSLESWQEVRAGDLKAITLEQRVLLSASSLLALFAIASIAVLVGGRMAEQTRRVGLLKAVGGTPRLVAVILLAENLLLAMAAAILGLAAGRLLAPTLTHAGSGQLGTPGSSPLTVESAALVALAAAAVAAAATIVPAIRGARTSTITALNDPARPPRRHRWLIALSARLPVPLLLGLRLLARRPGRAALTTACLLVVGESERRAFRAEQGGRRVARRPGPTRKQVRARDRIVETDRRR